MALDFQIVQAPFRLGLAEGVDPRQAPIGTLTKAENVVWRQSGRAEKRYGTTALSTGIVGGGSISTASRLFTRANELCMVDGTNLYAWSPIRNGGALMNKLPRAAVTWAPLADAVDGIVAYDSAISASGLRVDVWVTAFGTGSIGVPTARVVDTTSGSVVWGPQSVLSGGVGTRVLIVGNAAVFVAGDNPTTAIVASTLDLSTFALSLTTTLRNDVKQNAAFNYGFDACVIGSTFVVAYTNTGNTIKLYSYDASMVQQATGGITSEATGASMVAIDGAAGEVLYVLYSRIGAGDVRIATADPSTLAQVTATTLVTTPGNMYQVAVRRYDATKCIAAWSLVPAAGASRVTTEEIGSTCVADGTTIQHAYGAYLLSRPFLQNGRAWMFVTDAIMNDVTVQQNSCLVEINIGAASNLPFPLTGTVDPLVGGRLEAVPHGYPVPNVAQASSTQSVAPVAFQSSLPTDSTAPYRQGLRLVTVSTGASMPSDMWRSATFGAEAFITGGTLMSYDGRDVFPYGFLRAPSFLSLAVTNGGFGMAAGTYLYGSVFEFRSSTGLLYRSPTQTAGTATTAGGASKVTVTWYGTDLGYKQSPKVVTGTASQTQTLQTLYRSTVGGTVLQRRTRDPDPTQSTYYVSNSTTVFSDEISDATAGLATRPAIYTTGGILDDYAPPAGVTMFKHAERLFVLAGDQLTWWYSKSFQDDLGTAPGFHPNFRIVFDDPQTAGASMDDKAIFFSASGISYMLGLGPAPNGLNSDFSTPTKIQTDVGCTNPRSVVGTPDGVMFLSDRGLYLLTRGLETVWLGRPVKDTLALYPNVTSAVLVAKQNQVRFTCNDVAGTSGIVLVYDYVEKQWSTFRHTAGGVYGGAYADACMYNGAWAFVTTSGAVYVETTSSYLDSDGASYVPLTLETAWISANGSLSFQSVRQMTLHGESHTDHDLTISVAFDGSTSYTQVASFLATSPVTSVGVEDCSVTIGTQRKCNTIRFKIVDSFPSAGTLGTGQGPSFDMMGLEIGVKRGFGNNPATRKA